MDKNTWDYYVFRWDSSDKFCWAISKIRFDEVGLGFAYEVWLKRIEFRVLFWSVDIGWGLKSDLTDYS